MFQQPLDIMNRALQRCGLPRAGSTGDSQPIQEMVYNYDKLRRAEYRRNLWVFATRTTSLRALDTTSSLINFEAWAAGTTYAAGYVVTYGNLTWVSLIDANHGNTPGTAVASGQLAWDVYFGSRSANTWNDSVQNPSALSNTISYQVGEMVFFLTNGAIYTSLVQSNQNEPDVVDAYSGSIMYSTGDVVSFNSVNYQSLVNLNFDNEPDTSPSQWTTTVTNPLVSGSWLQLANATLSSAPIIYPVTAGPSSNTLTNNAFLKPAGFLRTAPQSPKAGASAWLGAHVGLTYSDVVEEGAYLTSGSYTTQLVLRFIADVTDVTTMDDMFCEGLAARLAMEVAPVIAPDRLRACQAIYNEVMAEARTVDAIELGPVEQDEDEFITCRL